MSDNEENNNEEPELEAWVRIQQNTFTNWVNDKLNSQDMEVDNIRKDFRDGVKLCKLAEVLVGRKIGKIIVKKNLNHYEASGNLALALQAMKDDGVRLVNIGAEDITEGNVKLILGMLWILIRRYQIGSQSKLPPKKLMLSWINAVLHPHLTINNFNTDWNDGVALHGIVEYCRPGTFPQWYTTSRGNWVGNCERAMSMASDLFGIPLVVSSSNFASRDLDELSGMTYLSYFMADDSPGFNATLGWVKQQISPRDVANFDSDWNNGLVLSALVHSLDGHLSGWPDIDTSNWTVACQQAMAVSESQLGVPSVLSAKDMINPEVDHIGVMAYAAWHRHAKAGPVPPSSPPPPVVVAAPPPPPPPVVIPVPEPAAVGVTIVENWHVDRTTTITVRAENENEGNLQATCKSPSDFTKDLHVMKVDKGFYHINFSPTDKGVWYVDILQDGVSVVGSPFKVNVFNAALASIIKTGDVASLNVPYVFQVDLLDVGLDDLTVHIVFDDETIENEISPSGVGRHRVSFTAKMRGPYIINVFCGGIAVPGSPFTVTAHDSSNIYASGDGLYSAIANKDADFQVDFSRNIGKMLEVIIKAPSGAEILADVINKTAGIVRVVYVPTEQGLHIITLVYDGVPLRDSPYSVNVRRGKVYVLDLDPQATLGQKTHFRIDASEMRKGMLEIDSNLPVQNYERVGENIYRVTIIPKTTGKHDLLIKYNGDIVEGSPHSIEVIEYIT